MERVATGRLREHAGRNASERRAGLENDNAEADPAEFGGRPTPLEKASDGSSGSAGVMATACRQGGVTEHGKPDTVEGRDLQPDAREGQAGPGRVAERLVVPWKPGNAGRGKEPQFKDNAARQRVGRLA